MFPDDSLLPSHVLQLGVECLREMKQRALDWRDTDQLTKGQWADGFDEAERASWIAVLKPSAFVLAIWTDEHQQD
ncbi:MAG: hypothetical protein KAI66_16150 [Lentisphaeria bacterium]|nr:hypothetical protein [Lentisphaeria bacterium]